MELRQYQKDVLNELMASYKKGNTKIILQAATGAGKTVMSAELIRYFVSKGKKVVFLAHRRELIIQASSTLSKLGVGHGIIMAGMRSNAFESVQVASIDTLRARALDNNQMDLPQADLLVIDEAHRSMSATYIRLMDKYESKGALLVIGLTATPVRSDGTGLGAIYTDMIQAPSIKELTENGSLVPAEYYAPTIPDLRKINTIAGDYNQKQLGEEMNKPKLVGHIVETYKALANGTKALVFASGVKHSQQISESFLDAGIEAAHLDGSTSNEERVDILERFNKGSLKVISNCMVLTEGFDAPVAQTCILARPTKSLSLYIQMVGRVLRPHETKSKAIVIDHSGAVHTNGFATDDHHWKLGTGRIKDNERKEPEEREEAQVTCEGCFHVHTGSNICPRCGHINKRSSGYVEYIDAQLGLVNKVTKKVAKAEKYGEGFKDRFYAELLGYCLVKKKKTGYAYHKYKERFGEDPIGSPTPIKPTKDTMSYIQHLNIKYARRRR